MVANTLDARTLLPGTQLGRYVLSHRVARGGMAELYLARVEGAGGFHKTVALKLVLPQLKDDADFMAMFRNEAKLSALLDHPNIAQVFDLGLERGEYFIAMEYVHGKNLASVLREAEHQVPIACALSIVAGACDGLSHAHELPMPGGERITVVHRDISPGNVLIRFDGIVKLVDFGIAKALTGTKLTRTGTIKGKVGYMSPEQCRGLELDRRTDIYCLGIMLYELTTGRRAFWGPSDFTVMNAIISGNYIRPSELDAEFPAELEAIIDRALATQRDERYATADELRRDLGRFAAQQGLELGSEPLREFVVGLFGEVPLPELDLGAEDRVTDPAADSSGTVLGPAASTSSVAVPSSIPWRALSYVAVAATAAAVALAYSAQDTPSQLPASVADSPSAPKQRSAERGDPADVVPEPEAKGLSLQPQAVGQSTVDSTRDSPIGPSPSTSSSSTSTPKTKTKKRSARRRRPRPEPAKVPEPAELDNDLRPPSLRK